MIKRLLPSLISFCFLIIIGLGFFILHLSNKLPSVETLRNTELEVPLRIYSADGSLIAEFGNERRIPMQIKDIPTDLIHAVLATEDQRFYQHSGVDYVGLVRAGVHVLLAGSKSQGGSTITMQVARNFFLTREKTYTRKINEILLAIKIEHELSKDQILELYLNKVFLGYRAYGVASAAQVYYGKSLSELSLAQYAMIAGLPQAPSAINPIANPTAAKARRQHVLDRMYELDYIDKNAYEAALAEPLDAYYHGGQTQTKAPFVAEMVRQDLLTILGDEAYSRGLQVYTTIDSRMQQAANLAVRTGLLAYDQRHGFRKPTQNLSGTKDWPATLKKLPTINQLQPAAITTVEDKSVKAQLPWGDIVTIKWEGLSWARRDLGNGRVTYPPKKAADILATGDVIYLDKQPDETWRLAQTPQAQSALVALNPQNGAILALVGGFNFYDKPFNRVTQATLQPGSNLKPFIYSAGLANGLTAASVINDAPIVIRQPMQEVWRPQNDNLTFNGPMRLREALVRSRNMVSIRILQSVGINKTIDYLARFGFDPKKMPHGLSLALGTPNVTPLEVVTAYAVFANGGYKVQPYFIDKILDREGKVVFKAQPYTVCTGCDDASNSAVASEIQPPQRIAPRVIDAQNAYIMTDILKDVIARGTSRGAKSLQRTDIAGKTGTTNEFMDGWFSGYNPDVVASVWIGFDKPRSLNEYGAQAALPIWRDFMAVALEGKPEHNLPEPSGLVRATIDPTTGLLAYPGEPHVFSEIFTQGTMPTQQASFIPDQSPSQHSNHDSSNSALSPEDLF